MRAKLILPTIAVASTLACLGINSGAAFATTAAEAGFEDEDFYGCVLTALEKTAEDEITDQMIADVTTIDCSVHGDGIMSLAGVEKMPNLTTLKLFNIKAHTINLSHNTKLEKIDFYNNFLLNDIAIHEIQLPETDTLTHLSIRMSEMSHIDVSKNSKLKELNITSGELESIDSSNNPDLEKLNLCGNKLTSVDVTKNTKLTDLYLSENKLTTINLSHNPLLKTLLIDKNELTNLDLRHNTELEAIIAYENHLTELNLTNNQKLRSVNVDTIDVYSGIEHSEDAAPGTYDLTPAAYSYAGTKMIGESDNYTFDENTHILTATDPETFDGIVLVNPRGGNTDPSFRMHLTAKEYPEEQEDEPEVDPESLPETDTTDETEPEAVPSNPKTSDPIVASILLGLAFGLAACLVSVKLTRRR